MPVVRDERDMRVFLAVAITAFVNLFLGIEFEFWGKLLMMAGSLYVAYEILGKLGILDYLHLKKSERKLAKKKKREKKRGKS